MILVTGGCGYLGSHCTINLVNKGNRVIVVDNNSNSDPSIIKKLRKLTNKNITFFKVDVRDEIAMNRIFSEYKIESIFHFAGLKSISESFEIPTDYYDVNINSTLKLLKYMTKYYVKKIIFSSSATVYSNNNMLPWNENLKLTFPNNPYAQTKYINEKIIMNYVKSNRDVTAAILRYFNPIGNHKSGLIGDDFKNNKNNLIPAIIRSIINPNIELKIYGNDYDTKDGTGVRDYIHVNDLIEGHISALDYISEKKGFHIWNLGIGEGLTVMEIINEFESQMGYKINFSFSDRRKGDLAAYWSDVSKANNELKWYANLKKTEMIKDILNYVKKIENEN